jgi:hypothetical protein
MLTPLHWKAFMGWLRILVVREVYDLPRKRERVELAELMNRE